MCQHRLVLVSRVATSTPVLAASPARARGGMPGHLMGWQAMYGDLATGDNVLGTFSLFGNRSRPLGYSSLAEPNTWVVSADEVTTYSVSGASSSGALLQCNTPFCEVRMSIGSLTEPPILRLGPNVEAAVTSISANNAVIIVKLDNPDTQFNCGGSASTRQCIVQRPPAYPPPP